MRPDPASCPACGAALPEGARFCPTCGHRVEAGGGGDTAVAAQTPGEEGAAPVVVEQVRPRLFGVLPPLTALGLGLAALPLALLAFAAGTWLIGLLLLLTAVVLLALFAEGARRFRVTDPASRFAVTLLERVRAWSGFATGSATAWSQAGRELVAARRELAGARAELQRTQLELGGAAYRDDAAETKRLRERMHELDDRARGCELRIQQALEHARRRVVQERAAIQPTEVVQTDGESLDGGGGEVVPAEGAADDGKAAGDDTASAPR